MNGSHKIALCFSGCFRRGGVERVVLATANGLAARGHEVHVFAGRIEADELDGRVTPHVVDAPDGPPAWALLRFGAACARAMVGQRFDAVGGFGVACPACDLGWVQSVHARWLEVSRGPAGGGRAQQLRRRLNPFHTAALRMERRRFGMTRPGDAISGGASGGHRRLVALTDEVGDDLQRVYGVSPDRIETLPNGVDAEAFNPARAAALRADCRRRFGLADGDTVLSFVANESLRKGLPTLLEAVARLGHPGLNILAAGRLPEAEVRAHARRLGVEDTLRFTGPLDDVTAAYAAGDVFVLPTHYEAWGLVIVEALACGLPVVTTRLAGAAEAVDHRRTGVLLDDPASAVELAAALTLTLHGLPTTAEQRSASVARYHWPHLIERYESLLMRAAAERSTPVHNRAAAVAVGG